LQIYTNFGLRHDTRTGRPEAATITMEFVMKNVKRTSPDQPPNVRRSFLSVVGNCSALAIACALFSSRCPVNAQSDNFDSYSSTAQLIAAGWFLSSLNPALVSTAFPTVAPGNKGLQIQAFPFPPDAPAVGMWYRTNDYTDFYMAVDIASWPGSQKDQAMVLFGRMTDAISGNIETNQNPGTAQGMICNYDAQQDGEAPTDRLGGEFQINLVTAPFGTVTLGACEMTLIPGRPYRMTFSGIGTHYVARVYDWNDLTTPLVTLEADDGGAYTHGACGMLVLHRTSPVESTNTVNVTYDNYYAGATDPNLATPPALSHPIPDTPVVATRTPAERWKNFLNPASGISFTANTYSANVINASATKLRLNGVDVSSQLVLSANGTTISGSLPGSALNANKLYSAELVVSDVAGTKSSTNTFWFDTFSDAFLLSSSVKTIEAEEYNFTNDVAAAGLFQLDPILVSGIDTNGLQINGFGVGYYALGGLAGIDYSNHSATPDGSFADFRSQDAVRTRNGGLLGIEDGIYPTGFDPGSDNIRSQHAASNLLEYVVCRTEVPAGTNQGYEWMNYTRDFAPGFYAAYLRYSSWGETSNELHLVTSDPTQTNQTTVKLGTFKIPNNIRYANYLYTPLVDDTGAQPLLNLTGTNTLRQVITGAPSKDNRLIMLNYLMLVQAPVAVFSSGTVNGSYTLEGSATVNVATRQVTIPAPADARYYRIGSNVAVSIKSISVGGGTVTLNL